MRKYRVWEANRKVFLWPENWIEPELKKDRSPFFKDLENELLQNEINQYTVETAFSNYLEKLDGVAQLEIAGFYQEDDGDNAIIHVFGRTPGAEPHLYYYRRYDYRQWTPWEKVDLDIQGDYLIPAVVNKRLFLFWPVFTEVPDEAGNSTANSHLSSTKQNDASADKAKKKLRLQMAVSDYRQGKWTPKRISKDFDESELVRRRNRQEALPVLSRSTAARSTGASASSTTVTASAATDTNYASDLYRRVRDRRLQGCAGAEPTFPATFSTPFDRNGLRPATTRHFMKWVELGHRYGSRADYPQNDFTLENVLCQSDTTTSALTPVLMQTPWIFKMTPPWHLSYLDKLLARRTVWRLARALQRQAHASVGSWLPFFYNDKKRTFFVLPVTLGSRRRTHGRTVGAEASDTTIRKSKKPSASWKTTSRDRCKPGWTASTSPP